MQYKNLLDLITQSNKILITSHISPDADALGSSLFFYSILKNNFPDKSITISMEGPLPSDFSFLKYFNEIINIPLVESIEKYSPDLFIMLDGNTYKRFSKFDFEKVQNLISNAGTKTVVIDHHLLAGKDDVTLFINNSKSSTAEDIYNILKEDLGFSVSKDEAEMIMFGIIGDTGRFLYKNPGHRNTFRVVSDLLDMGVSIEGLQLKMGTITPAHLLIIAEFMKNLSHTDSYNYSFVTDTFVKANILGKVEPDIFAASYHMFMDQYIRNVSPHKWGFVLVPDILGNPGDYKGSFRAMNDLLDTTVFAKLMSGGGHKPASGFKLMAPDYESALNTVHNVIKDNLEEAIKSK